MEKIFLSYDYDNDKLLQIKSVDMIATGTDVKPLECLIFMRDVRSKNYFEQMLGLRDIEKFISS